MPSSFKKAVLLLFIATGLLTALPVLAGGKAEDTIRQRLIQSIPGLKVKSVTKTDAPGMYGVITNNQGMIYATENGDFFLVGELYSVDKKGVTNLTETGRAKEREKLLAQVSPDDMIQFKPAGKVKEVINVFTDIDCPYCRKLNREVPRLNELGIQVNYLAYPRSGIDTPSYDKYVSVWCADDSKEAMNEAKAGRHVASQTCDNPVAKQFRLGGKLGVSGTPAIILDDGHMIRGYMPADDLARGIGIL